MPGASACTALRSTADSAVAGAGVFRACEAASPRPHPASESPAAASAAYNRTSCKRLFMTVSRATKWQAGTLACRPMKQLPFGTPPFEAILEARLSRRTLLGTGAAAGLAACAGIPDSDRRPHREFVSIAPSQSDKFRIADGFRYNIVARWGDAIVTGQSSFDTSRLPADDWVNAGSAAAQERQFGTNADAVQYFPRTRGRAARGIVCVNHEYMN